MNATVGKQKRSNEEWLALLQRQPGDPERDNAFFELYQTLYAKARFFCLHRCHLAADEAHLLASDTVADKICQVLEGRGVDTFRGEANFVTYVTGWVLNAIRSHLRSKAYRDQRATLSLDAQSHDDERTQLASSGTGQIAEAQRDIDPNLKQALEDCLAKVNPQNMTILWHLRVERVHGDTLAADFGMTRNTIDLRASRTAAAIRTCLATKGYSNQDIWNAIS